MPRPFQNNKAQSTKHKGGIITKSSIRDSILADIHARNIQPRPRWQYILLHAGLWISGIITIILGSFACALAILEFSLPERAYMRWMEMNDSPWLLALPYLWGIGMIAALTISYFIFSKTGRGYRFHAGAISALLILSSFVGWEIMFLSGFAHQWDRMMQRFQPQYREFRAGFRHMMPRPEEGLLPIQVLNIDENDCKQSVVNSLRDPEGSSDPRTGKQVFCMSYRGKSPDWADWQVFLRCENSECEEAATKIQLLRPTLFEGKIRENHIFDAGDVRKPGRPERR